MLAKSCVVAIITVGLFGCSNCQRLEPQEETATWVGALTGTVIGAHFGGGTGQFVGAAIGAATGALIGNKASQGMESCSYCQNEQ